MVSALFYIFSLILGAGVGSFVNVLALRTVAGKSLILPRSFCDVCAKPLLPRDLVPVVSFMILKARCRFCRAKISWQYPLVEAVTALLFMVAAFRFGWGWELALAWISIAALIALFLTDLRAMVLPDRITIPTIVVLILIRLFLLHQTTLLVLVLAVLVGGGFFFVQYWVSKGAWVGSGDIRMGVLMAAALGRPELVVVALFVSYILGAAVSIPLLLLRKKGLKSEVPLGTFLAIGTLFVLLMVGG